MSGGSGGNEFSPEVLFQRPDLYLLEFEGPKALFVRMSRETYLRSIFTDRQRIVVASERTSSVPVSDLVSFYESQVLAQPKLGYIFHVAHAGSTLLARALDYTSQVLVYREPYALRQLAVESTLLSVGAYQERNWYRRLELVTGLLGRTYQGSQSAIIKANVPVNFILPQLMNLNPDSCGILLYARLRNYLLSVLKTPDHQRWVVGVARELASGIRRIEPLAGVAAETLPPAQAAACLWLAQMLSFGHLVQSTNRVRTLDCELLFERPADTLAASFELFGVEIATEKVRSIVSGELFSHHAKIPGLRFDNSARKAELDRLAESLGDHVDEGLTWVADVMGSRYVPDVLPAPLIA